MEKAEEGKWDAVREMMTARVELLQQRMTSTAAAVLEDQTHVRLNPSRISIIIISGIRISGIYIRF